MTCPSCGNSNIYRSHSRHPLEKTLRAVLPVHYYRCHDCDWRGMKTDLKWRKLSKYLISVLYVLLVAGLVIALIGTLLFFLVFRPG